MHSDNKTRSILCSPSRTSRNIIFLLWPILGIIIANYAIEISNGGNEWKTGDWLINYEAGIVRRGLLGQIFYTIAYFGINLKWLIFCSQSIIYISIYYLIIKIYLLRQRDAAWFMFLYSPAFLIFSLLDLKGGFRKEIILFLSFSIFSYFYATKKLNSKNIIIVYLIFVTAIFSHESTALALPFYIYIFFNASKFTIIKPRIAAFYSILFSLTAFAAIFFAMKFSGNEAIAKGICESLNLYEFSKNICSGAIDWLKFDAQYGRLQVSNLAEKYINVYPLYFLIAIIPVFLTTWINRFNFIFLIAAFLVFLPLYFVGIDWGRWIYIYVFLVFALILSESILSNTEIIRIPNWGIFFYLTVWSLPHSYATRVTFGWFEKFWSISSRLI